jgi:hypothetical protein
MAVKKVRENTIEDALVARVESLGGVAEKTKAIGSRGYFDRVVLLPGGRVIFCEVKKPRGGVVSRHQAQRHALYRQLGAEVAVIRTLDDINRLLP